MTYSIQLPIVAEGHWTTPEGVEVARDYLKAGEAMMDRLIL